MAARFTYLITLLDSSEQRNAVQTLEQRHALFNPALDDAKDALERGTGEAKAVLVAQFKGAAVDSTPTWQGIYELRGAKLALVARPGKPAKAAKPKTAKQVLAEERAKAVVRKEAAAERSLLPFNEFLIDRPCRDADQAHAVVENIIAAGGRVVFVYHTWKEAAGAKTIAVRVRAAITKSAFDLMLRTLDRVEWVQVNEAAQAVAA